MLNKFEEKKAVHGSVRNNWLYKSRVKLYCETRYRTWPNFELVWPNSVGPILIQDSHEKSRPLHIMGRQIWHNKWSPLIQRQRPDEGPVVTACVNPPWGGGRGNSWCCKVGQHEADQRCSGSSAWRNMPQATQALPFQWRHRRWTVSTKGSIQVIAHTTAYKDLNFSRANEGTKTVVVY